MLLALLGSLTRWLALRTRGPRAKVGGGQRRSRAHPWTFAAATASAEGGAGVLASLGLRRGQAADASARAACSWLRAEVRGGSGAPRRRRQGLRRRRQRRLLCSARFGAGPLMRLLTLRARGPGRR